MDGPSSDMGSLLICSWLGSMAYAVVTMQTATYSQHSQRDWLRLKVLVYTVFILDTINLVGQYAYVYTLLITAASDPNVWFSVMVVWPIALTTITGPIIMLLVNVFLINRLYGLSKSWLLCTSLLTLQLITLALTMFDAAKIISPPTTPEGARVVKGTLTTALILFVIIDTGIAVSMLWYLAKLRTPFKATRAMVNRLMLMILQSGTATTVISIALLIVFLAFPSLFFSPTAVTFLISHFYSLTLLLNLNVREQIRKAESSRTRSYLETRSRGHNLGEIQITQHRIVMTDAAEMYGINIRNMTNKETDADAELSAVETAGSEQ